MRVLRYLRGSADMFITVSHEGVATLAAMCDTVPQIAPHSPTKQDMLLLFWSNATICVGASRLHTTKQHRHPVGQTATATSRADTVRVACGTLYWVPSLVGHFSPVEDLCFWLKEAVKASVADAKCPPRSERCAFWCTSTVFGDTSL